jgi:ubiquinone/menaquinone biosynthesis C-methylase UbiE
VLLWPLLAGATYQDEIWLELPAERPVDEAAFEFALGTVAAASPRSPDAGLRVLDLGCGDGRLTARIAETGARVTGVDPSKVALERARKAHPELELVATAPDGSLPFADACFDVVVCVDVLQHVADTQRLMSEVRRVLAPSGWLAVTVPWHGVLKNVVIALGSFERHHDPLEPVLRFYARRSMKRLLDDFGFEQVRVRGVGGLPLMRRTLLARARRA